MKSDSKQVAFGMLGGAVGLAVGILAIMLGIAFVLTGYSFLGIAGAYYGIGGLIIGSTLLGASFVAGRRSSSRGPSPSEVE